MQQGYNILIASILSLFVILGWNAIVGSFTIENKPAKSVSIKKKHKLHNHATAGESVVINAKKISGSISRNGLSIDNIALSSYLSDNRKSNVQLLSPKGAKNAYFVDFGWISSSNVKLPDSSAIWSVDGDTLSTNSPVTFSWNNGDSIIFKVRLWIDEDYMFSIEKSIENQSSNDISIMPYTRINRALNDFNKSQIITHEGPIGVIKDSLLEIKYKDIAKGDKKFNIEDATNNKKWFGLSDKYWLVSMVFPEADDERLFIKHFLDDNEDHHFRVISTTQYQIIKSGQVFSEKSHLFVGPKELKILDDYKKNMNIALFDHALDFGILYFITKPIFILLQIFYELIGNFGIAIILLTLFIRILMLPLSIKSCMSMIKMKEIQPEIMKLKSLYKDDKAKLNKESMSLFKKDNVHPMSGCMPTLLQIPVFFALYKVLFITIEMRQAKFFAWIKDLSLPDPTNIFTLFGLIEWSHPEILSIGILPILLGATMVAQQKLTNAHYDDKAQAFMVMMMPYMFIILFASFPSGLVLYWIFNNIISILQQVIVKKYLTYKSLKKQRC